MSEPALTPAESMVLTVARSQSGRGDAVPPNTAAVLVMTVDRLAEDNDRLRGLLADVVTDFGAQHCDHLGDCDCKCECSMSRAAAAARGGTP